MAKFRLISILFMAALCARTAPAEDSADTIMSRVATNQDSSEKLRSQYIYQQHIKIITRKNSGKILREETADYHVIPKPDHTERTLEQLTGRYWHKGKYEDFSGEPVPEPDSTDGDLIHEFREDLTNDKSKDGLAKDLFPFTSDEQKNYKFRLLGQELFESRQSFHIAFTPIDDDDIDWAGEAYIDAQEFQPIYVFTKLSRRMPFGVRTFLGHRPPRHRLRRPLPPPGRWRLVPDKPRQRIPHPRLVPVQSHHDNLSGKQSLRAHPRRKQDRSPISLCRRERPARAAAYVKTSKISHGSHG